MMLQQMFGTQLAFPIRVAVAAIVIAALLGLTVLVMRRLAGRTSGGDRRGRVGPRLSVLDSISVDQRRRLVLIRRDEVEHLLLIGGNSDIVIEQNIGGTAAVEAPAAVAAPREAPSLQRPTPRRPIASAAAPAALAAEPTAAGLPAPPAEIPAAPVASEAREDRRAALARRPLLRADGTLSGRDAPKIETARPDPVRPDPARPDPARPDPARPDPARPDQARIEALKAEFAASTPRIETSRSEPPKAEPVQPEPEDAPVAVRAGAAEPAEAAHRADAALVQPPPAAAAAPQISLSDLLGDVPDAPAEPPPPAPSEPVIEPPPAPARARSSEGPLSRFLSQSRTRSAEARPAEPRSVEPRTTVEARTVEPRSVEPRPRLDAAPRTDTAPRTEMPPRPREFSFRPAAESRPLPAPDQPRREPFALRDVSREEAPRPEASSPLLRAPSPTVTPVSADVAAPLVPPAPGQAAAPPAAPPVVASPVPAGEAPRVEPEAPRDPLDDFDAEMANLLGRSNARSR